MSPIYYPFVVAAILNSNGVYDGGLSSPTVSLGPGQSQLPWILFGIDNTASPAGTKIAVFSVANPWDNASSAGAQQISNIFVLP
jgi:hypothetical protein